MSVPASNARGERTRELLDGTCPWNDPPHERLAVIAELFALGHEATLDGYVAEAQGYAYECQRRLEAHLFMVRVVEEHAS